MDRAHRAGTRGLFELSKASPPDMRSENALIVANGDYVMPHGFTNVGQHANGIAADIVRIEDGRLAEHWDHPGQATRDESTSGLPMFKAEFPSSTPR
jgi:predicted SnoaL-like aldol condensation-catalyzing enzyme